MNRSQQPDIGFFLPMIPPTTTHQTKAVRIAKGRPVFYEPANLADARQKLTAHLARHKPPEPFDGPVCLAVKWLFPAGTAHRDGEWRTSKPDTDNLSKLLKDCMTAVGFWRNDALVCSEHVDKLWARVPGILIAIHGLGGENSAYDL